MFVIAREFVGALKAARLFASEDVTRPVLNCVQVEATGSALRIVSTDGHTLWCCEVPARDSAADPAPAYQTPWNISLKDVDSIAKSLKDSAEVEILLPKRTVAGVEYAQRVDQGVLYRAVVPCIAAMTTGKVLPEFAAEYVARCCSALTHYSKGFAPGLLKKGSKLEKEKARVGHDAFLSPPIAWRSAGELDPAIFYSPKFPSAFAIVMPRRGGGGTTAEVESFVERVRTDRPLKEKVA